MRLCLIGLLLCGCGGGAFAPSDAGSADATYDNPPIYAPDASMTGDSTNPGDTGNGGDVGGDVVKPGEAGCPAPTTLECSGTCVDPTTVANCGTCGTKCEADSSTSVCANEMCTSSCAGSTPDNCSGTCTNTQTSASHCGTCTNVCNGPDSGAGTGVCTGGMCTVSCNADAGTPMFCPGVGTCVDPTVPTSCGSCTLHCAGPMTDAGVSTSNGKPVCALSNDAGMSPDGGACGILCNPTFHNCGSDCLSNADDPAADPCVVGTPGTGVFVSSTPVSGASGPIGSMTNPYTKVTDGIGAAVATGGAKRVYVCIGTYNEQVSLTSADDGVVVYGGLDCNTGWNYVGNTQGPTLVATPTSIATPGTALTVTGPMTTGVTFEDMSFTSPNYSSVAGDSSVAVFLSNASVTLTRVAVTAGTGVPGVAGGTTSNWVGSAQGGNPAGQGPTATTGGAGGANSCSDGSTSSTGGDGGGQITTVQWGSGLPGTSMPAVPGAQNNGGDGAPGTRGLDGQALTQGGAGATSTGGVSASGWSLGSLATPGHEGNPAQGGGGGGGGQNSGGGGGGGAGGCGGGAGSAGSNGGSSIGVLVFQSTIALHTVNITTSAAGSGGSGGNGQGGQSGGSGGASFLNGSVAGGLGGTGSSGTGGGGGAGGNSIGVAWLGTTGPIVDGSQVTSAATYSATSTVTTGTAGAVGQAGTPLGGNGTGGSNYAIQQFQ